MQPDASSIFIYRNCTLNLEPMGKCFVFIKREVFPFQFFTKENCPYSSNKGDLRENCSTKERRCIVLKTNTSIKEPN